MRARTYSRTLTLLAAALITAGCIVSTYEKVDDSGGGTGGTGGTSGGICTDTCLPGANGETPCCFDYPSAGPDFEDKCGYVVADLGGLCLPAAAPGESDDACNDLPNGADSLDGCCMPNGLCGFLDEKHGLGCVAAEAVTDGSALQACGTSSCGEYCDIADALSCPMVDSDGDLRVWECAEECLSDDCEVQMRAVLDNCQPGDVGQCQSAGDPVFKATTTGTCVSDIFELAICLQGRAVAQAPDCAQYCRVVTDVCTGSEMQYPDYSTCLAVCAGFEVGSLPAEPLKNTLACRFAGVALVGSCADAGPAGESGGTGFCGSTCETYCRILDEACPTQHGVMGGKSGCETACAGWPVSDFAWTPADSNTASCRLKYALSAATDSGNAAAHCAAADDVSTKCK